MRIALKSVLLLLGMAIAAMAFTAGTASAQETEVEFVSEETGLPCNPCISEGQGESHIVALPSGVMISTCSDSLRSTTYHNGTGEVEWTGTAHGAPGCNTTNCATGDEPHWPATNSGELGNGTGHSTRRICLRTSGTGAELHCDTEALGEVSGGSHSGSYSFSQICAGGARRLEGTGEGVSSDIEAIHHSE